MFIRFKNAIKIFAKREVAIGNKTEVHKKASSNFFCTTMLRFVFTKYFCFNHQTRQACTSWSGTPLQTRCDKIHLPKGPRGGCILGQILNLKITNCKWESNRVGIRKTNIRITEAFSKLSIFLFSQLKKKEWPKKWQMFDLSLATLF